MKVNYITPNTDYTPDGMYEFTQKVTLNKQEDYTINIYTSGRYILEINGRYICEGPCKSHEYTRYYDTVHTDAFCEGENEIKITVIHIFYRKRFTTVFKEEKPKVIFEAKSARNTIVSDESWHCYKNNKIDFNYMKWRFIPPYEFVDYSGDCEEYPLTVNGGFDFDAGIQTFCGIASGTLLEKRPIPMIFPGNEIEFKLVKKGKDFVELDAGEYMTAKVFFEFAPKTNAKIIYAECYSFDTGKNIRDDSNGFLEGYSDTVSSSDKITYSPFWFRAFRFIRIEAENIDNALISARAKRFNHPISGDYTFECSDDYFNRMHKVSINTMLCCTHDTFYDCPYYEQQQYEMDSAVEAAIWSRMTNDMRIFKKSIEDFAASQEGSGLLLSIYPSVIKQIIPGYSFFWIFMLKDYLEWTGDVAFVSKFTGNIEKIISCFETSLSPEGLVTRSRYWDFVDWTDEWDNGEPITEDGRAITIYSMYFAYALLCAENICIRLGRSGLAADYRTKYNSICESINKHCFDKEKGLYTDSTYPSAYSVHNIVWAVISGLVKGEDAVRLMERINEEGLVKPSFAMNYYTFRALEKCGKTEDIFENMGGWIRMLDDHCTTWCEHPGDVRSECHGWSSAPLYEFSSNILGVKFAYDGEITVKPVTAELEYAKGRVPTCFGDVFISWENKNSFTIEAKLPSGVKKRFILPDGTEYVFDEDVETVKL